MGKRGIRYSEKFVAFVDILGFKNRVTQSAADDDAESIARIIGRLAEERDIELYKNDGAEICPHSPKLSDDLSMRISQVSDCVVVSAEVSPAGGINIVNYCRRITERLLLREHVLCRGYLTRGKIYHEGNMFFGPAYQEAFDKEKMAAGGTPFVQVACAVSEYLAECSDECVRKKFSEMTVRSGELVAISPYKIFGRLGQWAVDPGKSTDTMRREVLSAIDIVDTIANFFADTKPDDKGAAAKVERSLQELTQWRSKLRELVDDIDMLSSPFPSPRR